MCCMQSRCVRCVSLMRQNLLNWLLVSQNNPKKKSGQALPARLHHTGVSTLHHGPVLTNDVPCSMSTKLQEISPLYNARLLTSNGSTMKSDC